MFSGIVFAFELTSFTGYTLMSSFSHTTRWIERVGVKAGYSLSAVVPKNTKMPQVKGINFCVNKSKRKERMRINSQIYSGLHLNAIKMHLIYSVLFIC